MNCSDRYGCSSCIIKPFLILSLFIVYKYIAKLPCIIMLFAYKIKILNLSNTKEEEN